MYCYITDKKHYFQNVSKSNSWYTVSHTLFSFKCFTLIIIKYTMLDRQTKDTQMLNNLINRQTDKDIGKDTDFK